MTRYRVGPDSELVHGQINMTSINQVEMGLQGVRCRKIRENILSTVVMENELTKAKERYIFKQNTEHKNDLQGCLC